MSMNSSSSANATISSYFSRSCSRLKPAASPPRVTFSRPLRSRLKPTPRASSVLTRPRTSTRPAVGGRMPAIARTSVDLPAPLAPRIPSTWPCLTSSETSLSASISRITRSRRPSRSRVALNVGRRSRDVRYVTETSSTLIVEGSSDAGASATGAACVSEADSELTLPGDEEQRPADEQDGGPRRAQGHVDRRRRVAVLEHLAPGGEQRPDRVGLEQPVPMVRHLVGVVEDRRRVQPYAQHVGQEALDVAEVDLEGGYEHRQPRGDDAEQRDDRDQPQQSRADRQPRQQVDRDVDHERRDEALERRDHRRQRQQRAREGGVEHEPPAPDDRP